MICRLAYPRARFRSDHRVTTHVAEAEATEQIRKTQELLDEALTAGLKRRVGYRLVVSDQVVFQELLNYGASGRLSGVAICQDCWYIFVPLRKSTATRCDGCSRRRPESFEDRGVDGHSYPYMRFNRDPIRHGDATFVGWATRRFIFCSECDQVCEATRKDRVTCGTACKEARRKRRAGGDAEELSPFAKESRAVRAKMRALVQAPVPETR